MYFNKPCFTCGMTTAFAHAARFDFVHAWLAQPMGLVLALLCGVGFWACLHSALTGSVAAALLGSNLARPRVLIVLAILGAGAWAYKWATWTGF